MPTYLVERYLPGRDRAWLEAALARLPKDRGCVAYLGSTFVPSDESCFCRFDAASAEQVRVVNEVAGVPFARIVAAMDLAVAQSGPFERRRLSMKRFLGFILVVAVTCGIAAASQARGGRAHDEVPPGIELTYTKWFAPGFPNMVGVVGGDIAGKFGGAIVERTPDPTGRFVHITAAYIVVAPDPADSFTAHVEGVQDNQTHTGAVDGRVVDGKLKNAHVHAEYTVITCSQAPSGTCFQGTIRVTRSSED